MILEHDGTDGGRQITKYPRLYQALNSNLKKIVTHDFCQQIIREDWVSSTETSNMIKLDNCSAQDYLGYYLFSVLFLPVHVFGCLYFKFEHLFKKDEKNDEDERKEEEKSYPSPTDRTSLRIFKECIYYFRCRVSFYNKLIIFSLLSAIHATDTSPTR